ncbi:MAG: ABC transporter permease [Vicinamibacteria bacterium]
MTVLQDLRFAARMLVKRPGFAFTGILTLALGIGANTAVFSVVDGVLLRPLPVQSPERLVIVWEHNLPRSRTHNVVNPANFLAWKERARSFESFTAFTQWGMNLAGEGEPERIQAGIVMSDFFATLGVSPSLGRGFTDGDGVPGAADVVVIADGLWKRRFGADPSVIGKTLQLNGRTQTVVGVMSASFSIPPGVELWVPQTVSENLRNARGRYMMSIARMAPGVSLGEARAEMLSIAAQLEKEFPERDAGWSVTVAPLHEDLVREARPATLLLFGAVALVLLIACGNLANLLLARALSREREVAVRRALGASQGRLLVQFLTEGLLLAAAGGALGVALAGPLLQALMGVVPAQVQALFDVTLNQKVLAFTALLSLASALIFGLAPAWSLARGSLAASLREGSAGSGASRQSRRLSRLLVGAEIAVSVVLLVGAGLLLRSFERLQGVDPGFDARALTFEVSLSGPAYAQGAAQSRFFAEAVSRLAAIPGVEAAGAISWRPIGNGSATSFTLGDRPQPAAGQEPVADVRMVTPGTFRALGMPLLRGRDFEPRDTPEQPTVVVVNEATVREFWPGQDPIGKRISMDWGRELDAEVVGVVGDVRLSGLDTEPRPTLYWAQTQLPNNFMSFVLRGSGSGQALLPSARAQLASLDASIPLARVGTLDEAVQDSLRQPRFTLALLAAFAGAAALLAAIGLFGVLSFAVGQRVPEIGVRLALGARPADVLRLVLRDGVRLAIAGTAAGLLGALALARVLAGLLFEVSPYDPAAFAGVLALVATVSLCAALLPALRASRVDPVQALRAE